MHFYLEMLLSTLAKKYMTLANYVRWHSLRTQHVNYLGLRVVFTSLILSLLLKDSIISLSSVDQSGRNIGSFKQSADLNNEPVFLLWEGKQVLNCFWLSIFSFQLEKEVLGKRGHSMAASVMPHSIFFSVPLGKSFVSLNDWGGLGRKLYYFKTKCLLYQLRSFSRS